MEDFVAERWIGGSVETKKGYADVNIASLQDSKSHCHLYNLDFDKAVVTFMFEGQK